MKDKRYSINLEFCGQSSMRYVARFCGVFISQTKTRKAAHAMVSEHKSERESQLNS